MIEIFLCIVVFLEGFAIILAMIIRCLPDDIEIIYNLLYYDQQEVGKDEETISTQ